MLNATFTDVLDGAETAFTGQACHIGVAADRVRGAGVPMPLISRRKLSLLELDFQGGKSHREQG